MRNLQREMGLLNAEYLVDGKPIKQAPNINMKVEEQAGQPPKITSTFSNESKSMGSPSDFAFDPMEFWSGISSVVDAEFSGPNSRVDVGIGGTTPTSRLVRDRIAPSNTFQDPMPPVETTAAPPVGGYMPGQIGIDPVSLAFANMPYNATGASLPPPAVDTPMGTGYGTPMRYGVGQDAQDVIMTPSTTAAPMDYGMPENYGVTQQVEAPYTGDAPSFTSQELGPDAMTAATLDAGVGDPALFSPIDDPEWVGVQEQAGVDIDTQKKTSAATVSAINEPAVPLSNNVNGQDASQNPIMSGQIFDPRQRQAEYLKQMNTIMMGGLMLDLAAAALGVKSRSASYMDGQLKILEQQMKFDDQARIYDATKAVYYPDGVYQNPGNQADVFDALMGTGMVTPAEASAISGYHPEGSSGYDTYYIAKEDGTIETVYVPKGEAPPEGATPSATVAKYEAERLNPAAGSDPTAMKIEAEVNRLRNDAALAEAREEHARAAQLRQRADDLLKLGGGASTKDEFGYTAERATFKDIYGSMVNNAGEFMTADNTFRIWEDEEQRKLPDSQHGNFIPWSKFRELWSDNITVKVMGPDGEMREEPGWLSIKPDPTESVYDLTIPTITNKADYDSLPSGKQYYDSNGSLATKP